jgi:hypothetical protein
VYRDAVLRALDFNEFDRRSDLPDQIAGTLYGDECVACAVYYQRRGGNSFDDFIRS